ncbi:MAG: acylphosphatase [Gammaproteobacteria bacterium]|nr:MAG: acylphosphatase [Gammaproteobacteria bacterium]
MFCVKGYVSGRVQGVGFRYFVSRHAGEYKIFGFARNLPDGRVEFLLQGEWESVQSVVENIRKGPSFSVVTDVEVSECECQDLGNRFMIM